MNNEVNLLEFKPKFLTNLIAYSREENDGYFSFRFITPALSNETILNWTCVEIIKLLNGETTLKDIVDYFVTKYKAPREVVYNDVVSIIQNFLDLQLLTWEGTNPFIDKYKFELGYGFSAYLADYKDVSKIIGYFKKANIMDEEKRNSQYRYINPYVDVVNLVNAETLKSGFLTKAQFIFVLEKEDKIRGVFFSMNNMKINVNSLIAVIMDDDTNVEDKFLEYVFSMIPQISKKSIKKFRLYLSDNDNIENTIFKEGHFVKGVTLEDELGYNQNVVEYNYCI
ncbi:MULTISPECIES: PqqD family protein [Eubacteriales]|uniref:Coenzyme PQQ synthesis protein D (PqqD) n=1 Tax=Acetivibrio thermocellus (strain ATCC 27405 / DSM 1237 / JCM 9322 / NBRC 103400 / NCIMB 10682 / NRRL B-4536 / VPI 7372) TaxID=203119 RepID=A3DG32_ACET2|nr:MULTISPECIES: PqqD family protein [Eubacteriales]ABN52911.1 hypothetical protein Cthe_1689 [Acetivibrio thermocellus ATCC 27405]